MNLDFNGILRSMGVSAALVVGTLVCLFIVKLIDDRITPFDDDKEICEGKNLALALRRAGLYLGFVIAIFPTIAGSTGGLRTDLVTLAVEAGIILAALFIAQFINGRLILGKLNETESLRQRNLAVGLVEFGQYIATGLILSGSLFGEGRISSALMFAVVGQIALLLVLAVYRSFSKIDLVGQIRDGNVAAGVFLGARLVAIGFLLWASITGDSLGWQTDLASFGLWFAFGLVLLWVVTWLADLLFLPEIKVSQAIIEQRNVAAVVKVAGVTIATAITVAAAVAG